MQLLYGSDGNTIRTLARTADMDEMTERALLGTYLCEPPAPTDAEYAETSGRPAALTYATTNLDGALRHTMVLIGRREDGRGTESGSYAHFILQEPEKEGYGEGFFRLLRYRFINRVDAPSYDALSLRRYEPSLSPAAGQEEIDPKLLKTVIGVLLTKDNSSLPVRLLADRGGEAYQERSLAILEAVYRHLPYDLRRKYGFCSYVVPGQQVPAGVKVVVMDPACVTGRTAEYLDLADQSLCELYRQVLPDIRGYVDMLFSMDDAHRERYFAGIDASLHGKALSVAEYVRLYESTRRWSEKPVEELLGEWVEYAALHEDASSPETGAFWGIVEARLTRACFDAYVSSRLDALGGTRISGWDASMRQLIRFADRLDTLKLPVDVFLAWQEKEILEPLRQEYRDEELIRALRQEKSLLQSSRVEGDSFKPVKEELLLAIDRAVARENEAIEQRVQEEIRVINDSMRIRPEDEIRDLIRIYKALEDSLRYRERTHSALSDAWVLAYKDFLIGRIVQFRQRELYREYRRQLDLAPSEVPRQVRLELEKALEQRCQWLREYEALRQLSICPRFVSVTEPKLGRIREMAREAGESDPAIELYNAEDNRSERSAQTSLEGMNKLLDFLKEPGSRVPGGCAGLLRANHWVSYELMRMGNLTPEHFEPLMMLEPENTGYAARLVENLFLYCDTSGMDLKGLCRELIGRYDSQACRRMQERWENDRKKRGLRDDPMEDFLREYSKQWKGSRSGPGRKGSEKNEARQALKRSGDKEEAEAAGDIPVYDGVPGERTSGTMDGVKGYRDVENADDGTHFREKVRTVPRTTLDGIVGSPEENPEEEEAGSPHALSRGILVALSVILCLFIAGFDLLYLAGRIAVVYTTLILVLDGVLLAALLSYCFFSLRS